MKGVVFVALSEMIQEMYGHRSWNEFLTESNVKSKGIYTATEIYEDLEANQLLTVISKKLGKNQGDVLYVFGLYLIKYFKRKYPQSFHQNNFIDFMSSVGSTIHVEIEKLFPNCSPPIIKVLKNEKNNYVIYYFSKRKLCHLAHGLISGAAKIYNEDVEISQTKCMHNGSDHCLFEVSYKKEL